MLAPALLKTKTALFILVSLVVFTNCKSEPNNLYQIVTLMKIFSIFCFLIVSSKIYCQQPQGKWATVLGGIESEESQTVYSDDSGNVYVASLYVNTSTICNVSLPAVSQQTASGNQTQNICITKLDKNGNCLWNVLGISKVLLNNSTVLSPQIRDMKFYKGSIYVCGTFNDSLCFPNALLGSVLAQDVVPFVLKLNSAGIVQWGKTFRTTQQNVSAQALCINAGGVFVTGFYEDSIKFGNIKLSHFTTSNSFLLRMDHNGNYKWAKNIANDYYNVAEDMCFDGNKYLYLAGNYTDTNFVGSAYVHKLDTAGNTVWRHSGPAKFGGAMQSHRLAYSNTGAVYLSGMFSDSLRCGATTYTTPQYVIKDILVKINTAGQLQWSKAIGHKNFTVGFGGIIETNSRGPIFFTGFGDTVTIGTQTYVSQGNLDNMLLQYDHSGNLLWKLVFGGTSQEQMKDLHCNNGAIYFTSRNMSTYPLANLNITHTGIGGDILIVKFFDELASNLFEVDKENDAVLIYPNPSEDVM